MGRVMSRQTLLAFISGALFGAGLALSRMTDPAVIQGFLDVTGAFDPTLLFVLGGAVGVTLITFRAVLRLRQPLCAPEFDLPSPRRIDPKLVAGAAVFGVGWGIAGFCPGPAIVAFTAGIPAAATFIPAMLLGSFAWHWISR
jgi:uncharacterized membrane protein YedE/YeeE